MCLPLTILFDCERLFKFVQFVAFNQNLQPKYSQSSCYCAGDLTSDSILKILFFFFYFLREIFFSKYLKESKRETKEIIFTFRNKMENGNISLFIMIKQEGKKVMAMTSLIEHDTLFPKIKKNEIKIKREN